MTTHIKHAYKQAFATVLINTDFFGINRDIYTYIYEFVGNPQFASPTLISPVFVQLLFSFNIITEIRSLT